MLASPLTVQKPLPLCSNVKRHACICFCRFLHRHMKNKMVYRGHRDTCCSRRIRSPLDRPACIFLSKLVPNQGCGKEIIPLSSLHSFASQEGLVFGHSFFLSVQAQPAFGALTQNPSLAPQSLQFGLSPLQASLFLWAEPPSLGDVNAAASPPTSPLRYQATPPANTTAATVAAGSPDLVADTVRVAVMLSCRPWYCESVARAYVPVARAAEPLLAGAVTSEVARGAAVVAAGLPVDH